MKIKKTKTKHAKRSKAPKSAFREWFYQQAGKPEFEVSNPKYFKLRDETIPGLRRDLYCAEARLKAVVEWEHARQYALYGWVARDKDCRDAP